MLLMQRLGIADLFDRGQRLALENQPQKAAALYADWLQRNPEDPLRHAVLFNQGVVLNQLNDLSGAAQAFGAAIERKPDFLPPHINLGAVYERRGAPEAALAHWAHAINQLAGVTGDTVSHKTTALKQTARLLEDAKRLGEAERLLRQLLELNPFQRDAVQHWISLRQRQCRWPLLEALGEISPERLLREMAPLSLATYTDDPVLQLAISYAYTRHDVPVPARFRTTDDFMPLPREERRLRIGYLSSDLRDHAIGYLTADLYHRHDRDRYEVFIYYCGIANDDDTKRRIRDSVEHWHDISRLDDEAAETLIHGHAIDILIDINGHTRGARTALLARRLAPVLVNWLGFPGSMGSPYHHYIIADDFIVPEGGERWFSETVLRLPCYQPNDRNRAVSLRMPTRAEVGLPDGVTVFCSFNGTQKITPHGFDRWIQILRGVPDSVLWLLKSCEEVEIHLRALVAKAGVAPERLIFAPMIANPEHVARYALADLFLDTSPYGAHTTASDALWMGVPVLTLPGRSFASRVCGSLVRSAGLPELICDTPDEYVARGVALGRDRGTLRLLRERLLAERETSVLFDTESFVQSMEVLFERMWDDFVGGRLPQPDLLNLDSYLEIGAALAHDSHDFSIGADVETLYRNGLAARHRFAPLPRDARLWPEGRAT